MNRLPRCFRFKSYSFEPQKRQVRFLYSFEFDEGESMEFVETLYLPARINYKNLPKGLLENVLQSVHLALGISYYKLFCPEKVETPYALSREQADFWTTLYRKGLGEFAFRNKLDQRKFAKFSAGRVGGAASAGTTAVCVVRKDRSLLGIGGGKDSIVAGELLKEAGKKFDAFLVETGAASEVVSDVVETMNVDSVMVRRELDKQVFHPIPGSYNGHIPISAIFAFVGILTAVLCDYGYVIVGNEYSSNFGNVKWNGEEVNHQWSKSVEFEKMLQNYVKNFITPDVTYFSLLRPFYEIRIAEMFTKYPKYFPVFTSCNRNFRVIKKLEGGGETRLRRVWCGECAKCAFVFAMLSAFLDKKRLVEIFGKDLYADENLKQMFKDLRGEGTIKPFDCVGTFEEMKVAMKMAEQVVHVHGIEPENVLKTMQVDTVPTEFCLLGMKNVLILGYGKEGKVTEEYLKKFHPKLKIGIADKSDEKSADGETYLQKQEKYDFVIKTPGIPKSKITRPYTTATNLFFAEIKKRGNTVIGVTGSKGKSTTASLIAHVLEVGLVDGWKKVRLLGNIGKPMLSALLAPIKKNEIFVLELSSYQLDDALYSPNIAVVTNLFPEHMNYHGDEEKYYDAKKNIIDHGAEVFVYNPKNALLRNWVKAAAGKKSGMKILPFAKKLPLKVSEIPLLGEHNKDNTSAAVTVGQILKIPDAKIKKAVKSFQGLRHRLQLVGTFKKIDFYDDAISTTPESTIAALNALKNTDTIFLGGEDRGYNFSELEKMLRKSKVRNIVLFPDTGKRMLKSEKGFNILHTKKMKEAVEFAYKNTKSGGACLMSMASPSYSLWKNFEVKGDEFQEIVRALSSR